MTNTRSLTLDDGRQDSAVEALYAHAFGPGRFAKAAARLREGNTFCPNLSFIATMNDVVVGACRLWPINTNLGDKALFLGPIAVDKSLRNAGLGQRLVKACLAAADAKQACAIILVGDLSYFGAFGFVIVPDGTIIMPGPVDPNRLLWRLPSDMMHHAPFGKLIVPRATSPKG